MKDYEALIILPVTLDEEGTDKAIQGIKDEIGRLGGSVSRVQMLGKRTFARPMKKQSTGFYARMWFELGGEAVAPLQARLKLNDDVFRIQVVCNEGGVPAEVAAEVAAGAATQEGPVLEPADEAEVSHG